MSATTRERIVEQSAELFRRQGFASTGVKQIVAEASAPFGSLYHFFPGGKEQLGEEVIRWSGAIYGRLIDEFFLPGADPVVVAGLSTRGHDHSLSDLGLSWLIAMVISFTVSLELVVLSKNKTPLLKAPLEKTDEKQELPVEFTATIEGNDRAILKMNLHGRYQAKLTLGVLTD